MDTRGRETRRHGGTGESGKLRWPTDRPRGETRRWTRWIQGGEESRPHGSAAQVGPRVGRGRSRGKTRRAHVWHTHRNHRADGRPFAEAVPWTTYLWWGRHVGSSSFLFLTVLRPPLFLFIVGFSRPCRSLAYPAILRISASQFPAKSPFSLRRSFLHGKSWKIWDSWITKPRLIVEYFSLFFSTLLNRQKRCCF